MGEETYSEGFVYDDHGRLTSKTVTQAGTETTVTNTYDALSRLSTQTGPVSKATYSYLAGANGTTTGLVSSVTHSKVGTNSFSPITFGYTYDKLGYITTYSQTGRIDTTYEYDQQGQLIQAMDNGECYNYSYTYDTVGNIRSLDAYCWGDSDYSYTNTYTYGNPKWLDLLTGFNDEPILYEGQSLVDGEILGDPVSGNPISYFNGTRWSFDWENGRQLATAEATDSTGTVDTLLSYEYDINGLRTSKTVTTNTYTLQEHTHNFTKTVVKEPTCTAAGSNLYTCSCGYSYEEHMPALGHVLMLVQNVYRCKRCGYEQQPVVIGPIQPPVDPPISTASVEQEDATAMSAEREEVTTSRVLASTVTEHHDYVYASGKLLREVITRTDADGNVTTEVLDFTYDASGSPYALTYTNGTETPVTYYYVVNLQGDVIRLVSTNGASVAQYWYGPYGEVRQAFGAMAEANPLRYRGYYYDADTEFYYLQSRYYDPAICRFINADGMAATGQGFLGCNMFAYCGNAPVSRIDASGNNWVDALYVQLEQAAQEDVKAKNKLETLLDEYAIISESGFSINIEAAASEWNACIQEIGVSEAYDYMAHYLCQEYKNKYGKEYLFREECVSYEIEYHVDAYMCKMGYSGYHRNITTFAMTKEYIISHCSTVDISTASVTDWMQSFMFQYYEGVRFEYRNTSKDPYATKIKIWSHEIWVR